MAKITIEIDTHDADETDRRILAAFGATQKAAAPAGVAEVQGDPVYQTPAETDDADPGDKPAPIHVPHQEAEAPKRTRRTKAQMEADAARATPPTTSQGSDASGPAVTETAPPAETASTPAGETEDGEKTLDMVNDRIRFLMGAGVPAKQLVDICKEHGGASSAKLCPVEKLPAIWEALGELMQG